TMVMVLQECGMRISELCTLKKGSVITDKEGAELLFTHLSLRAGRSSTIITSNLSFAKWEEVFHDPILTAALTDRLTHKSHVVNMIGPSYRMRETQKWLENSHS
ncbi:ATP-binding protein, partial [Mammaliicoccus sp. N-M52]